MVSPVEIFVSKSQGISNEDFFPILCMPFFSGQEAVFLQTDHLETHVTVSFCACWPSELSLAQSSCMR